MGCPLNIKRFLFTKYEGDHDFYYPACNRREESESSNWRVTENCKLCGEWHWRTFSKSHMIRLGLITVDGEIIDTEEPTDD